MYESKEVLQNRSLRSRYLDRNRGVIKYNDYDLTISKNSSHYVWNIYIDGVRKFTAEVRKFSKNSYRYSHCTDFGISCINETSLIRCLQKLDVDINTYTKLLKK